MSGYDVIVVGAGSVGVPAALSLGQRGLRTLVIDANASAGQGENKHAIGGIRATHSAPGKILVGERSLEVFSTWRERYGDDIEWHEGGYLFPVYRDHEEQLLKGYLPVQRAHGLQIDFVGPRDVRELVPGITVEGLRGGTWSPRDGSASPLLTVDAFRRAARTTGRVDFRFGERVTAVERDGDRVSGVLTDRSHYAAPVVVDAAGPYSRELGATLGLNVPVFPDSHEGAITEPVQPLFRPMVVDLRPGPSSRNYYFYQNGRGQIVFCITPDPPIGGTDHRETSTFLPQVARRMVALLPRLAGIRVRRVWRGLYPMSPDGSPLLGWSRDVEGLLHATGMCGQGYMLGPGVGEIIARMVADSTTDDDRIVLDDFSPYRVFSGEEALK